jgi:hypothetical protein
MKKIEAEKEKAYDNYGETDERYIALERDYYYEFAKVELLTDLVKAVRKAARAAQEKVDEARLGGGLSDYDKRDLTEKIAAANALVNAAGEPDTDLIFVALKNLEEDMAF